MKASFYGLMAERFQLVPVYGYSAAETGRGNASAIVEKRKLHWLSLSSSTVKFLLLMRSTETFIGFLFLLGTLPLLWRGGILGAFVSLIFLCISRIAGSRITWDETMIKSWSAVMCEALRKSSALRMAKIDKETRLEDLSYFLMHTERDISREFMVLYGKEASLSAIRLSEAMSGVMSADEQDVIDIDGTSAEIIHCILEMRNPMMPSEFRKSIRRKVTLQADTVTPTVTWEIKPPELKFKWERNPLRKPGISRYTIEEKNKFRKDRVLSLLNPVSNANSARRISGHDGS